MWFLADGRVHHVPLVVPRTLYVDSEVPLEHAPADSARFSQATPGEEMYECMHAMHACTQACLQTCARCLAGHADVGTSLKGH